MGRRPRGGVVTEESRERAALCVTLERVGPSAPTLCSRPTAEDLLAYLLVGERRFLTSLLGLLVPAVASSAEAKMRHRSWGEMIELLRAGPAWWWPSARPGDGLDFLKLFVHHEDIRRASPGWEPRPPELYRDEVLWQAAARLGRLAYRRSPVGVRLRRPDGVSWQVKPGTETVTMIGDPGELVVHMCGRRAARVRPTGAPKDIAAALDTRQGTLFGGVAEE